MKKVNLRMNEKNRYEIIKKLVDTDGNKDRAALQICCTKRTINRMIKGYKEQGKTFFVHGNRDRKPAHTLSRGQRKLILDLYLTKYSDANINHFVELLDSHENIYVSHGTVRTILFEANILSPKAQRKTKKQMKKKLKIERENANTRKEILKIDKSLLELNEAHPRRSRCAFFGEMLQMDASIHNWFGNTKTYLHIAIDDATGTIVGAYFDRQETLKGYYNVFYQVLKTHGIPYMFYTDNRTIFEYKQKNNPSIEKDSFTQFSYACHQLGVEIKTSSIPQAKGRVERLFQTLQSRLPVELRLAGVTDIAHANQFLNSYIKEFNKQFGLSPDNIKSVFETQPSDEKINLTLSVITHRKIDAGHSIRFEKKYYTPVNNNGDNTYFLKGTNAVVIRSFDGNFYSNINDSVYALIEIPMYEKESRNFGVKKSTKAQLKPNIPSMYHPWRPNTINKFFKNNIKHFEHSFEDQMYTQHNYY